MKQKEHLTSLLQETQAYPLLGKQFTERDYHQVSFNACDGFDLTTNAGLQSCIDKQLNSTNSSIGYGGYLEDRSIYRRSAHFQQEGEARSIHLGLDIWAAAETSLFAPIEGAIHSWAYNDAPADYGATIILQHEIKGKTFHTLYGHLSRQDLQSLKRGQNIHKGQAFCHIGPEEDNGGWVPHLHFQIIIDMQGKKGDYPGVSTPSEKNFYQKNCPDPVLLFSF
jgi:murein DD-endopeptidase MepM/ murein hydrolase activator NlpD